MYWHARVRRPIYTTLPLPGSLCPPFPISVNNSKIEPSFRKAPLSSHPVPLDGLFRLFEVINYAEIIIYDVVDIKSFSTNSVIVIG